MWHVLEGKYIGDHGTHGFISAMEAPTTFGYKDTSGATHKRNPDDWVMVLADDEWLEPTAIEDLMWAANAERADFVIHHRQFPDALQRPGEPEPRPDNMTTGLFRRWLWGVANILGNGKRRYTQPGADGQLGYDWVMAGAKCVSVPKVLSVIVQP